MSARPRPRTVFPEKLRGSRPSLKRIGVWRKLRQWQRRPAQHDRRNVYELTALLGQIAANRVRPLCLDEFGLEKPVKAILLGWVVVTCQVRRAYAVRGTRAQWGELLHCHPNTFDKLKEELIAEGWLQQIADFKAHKGRGRSGERIKHRQQTNWYAPGPRLREAFARFEGARLVEPKKEASKSSTERSLDQNCDPSSLTHQILTDHTRIRARSESPPLASRKESPTAKEDQKSPSAIDGAQGPLEVSPLTAPTHQQTTQAAPQAATAVPEGPPGLLSRERRASAVPMPDILKLVAESSLTTSEKRQLCAAYVRNPIETEPLVRATVGSSERGR